MSLESVISLSKVDYYSVWQPTFKGDLFCWHPQIQTGNLFMQSMGTLNSPSSRDVNDSTPYRHRILRCINLGICASSPNLFLNMNLYLVKFEARWTLNERAIYCLLLYLKLNLDLEKKNQLGESSPNFIFTAVNLDPIVIEKRWTDGESWPNDFVEKVNRGEDLRWVVSRCPLTCALK